jgi:site-specific DNA-methyltransferase (adenine-specific)
MRPYYEQDGITIYHGDCRDVLPRLERGSVTLLWSDPPYGHSNNSGDLQASRVGIKGARQAPVVAIANDSEDSMREVVDAALRLAVLVLRGDCCCCCCCCCGGGPRPTFAWLAERMDQNGLVFFHSVIWDKSARGDGLGWRFRRNHEMVMVAHRLGGKLAWADEAKAIPNVMRDMPVFSRQHPNEKPESLVAGFITATTKVGELVLDPFMGSGTTLVAAKRLGRRAIGIELEERYCEIAVKRLQQGALPMEFSA